MLSEWMLKIMGQTILWHCLLNYLITGLIVVEKVDTVNNERTEFCVAVTGTNRLEKKAKSSPHISSPNFSDHFAVQNFSPCKIFPLAKSFCVLRVLCFVYFNNTSEKHYRLPSLSVFCTWHKCKILLKII